MNRSSPKQEQEAAESRLQCRMVAFIRALGLLQLDSTPCGQPVSVSEAHSLIELRRDGPLPQTAIGRRLRLEKSTVSRLIAGLVDRGWVERTPDAADGRVMRLRLTVPGERMADQIETARTARYAALLAAIPREERDNVLRALAVLTVALDSPPAVELPASRGRSAERAADSP